LDKYPITGRSIERFYPIDGDQFERTYKHHLSGFTEWTDVGHAQDWLVFPENVGPFLSIDETALSRGELYTILSNKDAHGHKGTIVAIVKGTRIEDVVNVLKKLPTEMRLNVKEVTMDLSDSMHAIVGTIFPEAMITLDRFHVQQLCSDAMQEVRMRIKREARKAEIESREKHTSKLQHRLDYRKKDKTDKRGRKPKRKNEAYKPERLENGDTLIELITRSRYLLMTSSDNWTESQKLRARLLFERFPEMKTAYSLTHSLRMIFSNKKATKESAVESLKKWYNKVTDFDNDAFNTASATIYQREDEILNYFVNRSTNASAESLNAKIKHFRAQLRGVIDVDFFLYRLSLIYA
jgi:transposase